MHLFLSFLLASSLMVISCKAAGKTPGLYADIVTSEGTITVRLYERETPVTVSNFTQLAEGKKKWTTPAGKEVTKPFYDGLIFHRVISNFMLQGGCPKGDGTGGPGYAFVDEVVSKVAVEGPVTNEVMAYAVWNRYIIPEMRKPNPSSQIKSIYERVQVEQKGTAIMGRSVDDYRKMSGDTNHYEYPVIIHNVGYGTLCMANSGPNSNGSQFFIVTARGGCNWLDGKHTVFGEVTSGMEVAHLIESQKLGENDRPVKTVTIKTIKVRRV